MLYYVMDIKVTLYHADWCGHCKQFMPEWNKFANEYKTLNESDFKIEHDSIESGSGANETINNEPIKGYPTIKLSVTVNKNFSKEYEYIRERNSKSLINVL